MLEGWFFLDSRFWRNDNLLGAWLREYSIINAVTY